MYSIAEITSRSISTSELVLDYTDAMELLYLYELDGVSISGWEGWLSFSSGKMSHSTSHQGTTDLSEMPYKSAIALAKSTIMQAHTEWSELKEADNAELYFCITKNT
jgi:hypothetical protein